MSDVKANNDKAKVELLTTPSLVGQLAFAQDNAKSGLVYGRTHRYLEGKMLDLSNRAKATGRIETLEEEREEIISNPNNQPIYTPYGVQSTAASLAADIKVADIDAELEQLKEHVPMPSAKTMKALRSMANDVDTRILEMDIYLYNLKNWDKLTDEQKEVFLPQLEAINKKDHEEATQKHYDSVKEVTNYRPQRGMPSAMMFEDGEGRMVAMVPDVPAPAEYKSVTLDDKNLCDSLAKRVLSRGKDSLQEFTDLANEKIDRMMGEYPSIAMNEAEIDAAMDKMWTSFGTRTGINLACGIAGMGIGSAFIRAGGAKFAGGVATDVTAALLPRSAAMALQTGGSEALGTGFVALTKVTAFGGALAGGVIAETPIDMGLSALYETEGDYSLENYGLVLPEPEPGEIHEMVKKEVYKDVNPLTWLSLKMGYENSFTQTPELYLYGKPIPSLCVPYERFEAGALGEDKEIAERIATVEDFVSFYGRCNDKMNVYRDKAQKIEEEFKQEKHEMEPLAATDPMVNYINNTERSNVRE